MRDFIALRRRLLVAMGLFGAGTVACAAPAAGTSTSAVDDGASATEALGDAVQDTGDGQSAVDGADVGDVGGGSDVSTDSSVGVDTDGTLGGDTVGDAGGDTASDSVGDAGGDSGGDGSADGVIGDGGLSMDVCTFGKPQQECMNAAQLAYAVDNKWGGGEQVDAGAADAGPPKIDYPVPPEGCPVKERVFDGCCNPAHDGPIMVGDTCCYVFCTGGCCGRPLRAGGVAILADMRADAGWSGLGFSEGDAARADALSADVRAAIAKAWAGDAALEHASIASFQRFGLELLRLGAPVDLVADAARAVLDEVDHAERCFALASLAAGTPIGPAALPLPAAVQLAPDLRAAALAAVEEGCVGETLAAALCAEAARTAKVPAVQTALRQIAEDEARHAELAWRFVRWALRTDATLRPAVAEAFERAMQRLPEPPPQPAVDLANWEAWGRLPSHRFRAVVRAMAREVLQPCAAALCGRDVVFDVERMRSVARA